MALYHVPQYIDIEDKIIGPLTLKQFLYLLTDAMIIVVLWQVLTPQMTLIVAVPLTILFLLLAFYKVNGRPFLWFLGAVLHYLLTGKLFIWDRRPEETPLNIYSEEAAITARLVAEGLEKVRVSEVNEARLLHLARILDTAGSVVGEDAELPPNFDLGAEPRKGLKPVRRPAPIEERVRGIKEPAEV
jgi:hypothetical protein